MAGTINTTNYNFKKYAPDDTVSMLQTFNGDMDAIDKAIKDRENIETEQGASIAKLESGLSNANNAINSANQTISAVQVQVTTNTRNIQSTNTGIDSLDARVKALEDGGSAIENVNVTTAFQYASGFYKIYKQGTHYFGTGYGSYGAVIATNIVSVSSCDNIALTSTTNFIKLLSIIGNPFGLNPNIGHAIGNAMETHRISQATSPVPDFVIALYDGATTWICTRGETNLSEYNVMINIDTVV